MNTNLGLTLTLRGRLISLGVKNAAFNIFNHHPPPENVVYDVRKFHHVNPFFKTCLNFVYVINLSYRWHHYRFDLSSQNVVTAGPPPTCTFTIRFLRLQIYETSPTSPGKILKKFPFLKYVLSPSHLRGGQLSVCPLRSRQRRQLRA